MGMTRDDGAQQSRWVSAADLPRGRGRPFYERLNRVYVAKTGRPGLAPGRYFGLLLKRG